MENSDIIIERIRQSELLKTPKFFQQFVDAYIVPTSEIENSFKVDNKKTFREFKPNILNKLFPIAFLTGIFSITLIFILKEPYSEIPGKILMFSQLIGVGIFMSYTVLNKKVNYKIHLDKNEIRIRDKTFKWIDIYETAIFYSKGNMRTTEYLLIVLNDPKKKLRNV